MRLRRLIFFALGLMLLCSCSGPSEDQGESAPGVDPDTADVETWFAEVVGEGGRWLSPEALRHIGINARASSPPALRLSWDDEPMPYLPQQAGEGWGLFFFAPDRAPRTSRRTAVRLDRDVEGPLMEGAQAAGGEATALDDDAAGCNPGVYTARWERDLRYLPQGEAQTPWFWQPLRTPGSVTETLTLTDAVAGPITVTLDLWSHTATAADPDHRLLLRWDGERVGEWTWDGQGMQQLTASFSLPQPRGDGAGAPEQEHHLTIETPPLPGAEVALLWLDGWDVSYRRAVTADGRVWRAEGAGLRVEQAPAGARVVDVSDPFAARDLGPVAAGDCIQTVPGRRYWVGVPGEARAPASLRPAQHLDLDPLQEVDYLAVAPPPFHAALQPLLDHRQAQGLTAAVVQPQAVYDALGAGQPDPAALQALTRRLPSLRYLLLVGDGTAEPNGSEGEDAALRVVVPFTRTASLGEAPADALLGTDGAGKPVVAVGRFPAASAEQVAVMVEKTIQWEEEAQPPRTLLLSDDEAEFDRMAGEIADQLPPGLAPRRLDAGDEESRSDLLDALQQPGPAWLNYSGHGSLTLLCDEGLLTLEDGEQWRDPALVVAWTCLAAHYAHPTQPSMAEAWLQAPQGGAVAFLGPVGETTSSQQRPFAQAFYRALSEGDQPRLGDAWLAALQEGPAADVRWGYVLLGDPALRLNLQ